MACFERASPALGEILLKIHRAERPMEIDHHVHEFGSVHYHVQCSASDPIYTYLSISTPLLSEGLPLSSELPRHTLEMVREICPEVMEIVEPPKEGYQLTLKLNFSRILNTNITAVFPMRFKENEDVIIATAFFQELMDVGNSEACPKAPHCTWSPIPPPELRGEPIEDLSTNCGFVSYYITSCGRQETRQDCVEPTELLYICEISFEGKQSSEAINYWTLSHLEANLRLKQSTRGFIQRRMRMRVERLVQHLQHVEIEEDQQLKKKAQESRYMASAVLEDDGCQCPDFLQ
ncbi:hypothetical protein DH2020_043469 [Rehmannia glutinosa]|uniref:Arp2/3 complex 34 kDa subunit n=1 Tax=Rehmannia glutinosa TaxID=99300 RepID=A0ABR0UKG3_REHGL